ncbi:hypothetical protein ACFLR5_02095, partial [Elusimicrobiota bacterium]
KTEKNIISAVTRKFASKSDFDYYMVVNMGFFKKEKKAQIYVRKSDKATGINTNKFKELALELSAQVGGKEEVAGIIIDDDRVSEYISRVKEFCRQDLM